MTKCIDISNYSGNHPTGIPTPDDVRCLLADGWQTAIVGGSYGTIATAQLDACAAGGMDVEVYAFIEFRDGWEAAIDRALAALTGHVRRLWLDCEESSPLGPSGTAQRIHDAIAYVHAARPDLELGIYTGGWWWTPETNDSHEFADMPLWTAEYDSRIVSPTMYGGWTQAAIWQYQGSVDTCGLNADRNLILEGGDVTQQDKDEIVQDVKNYLDMKLIQLIAYLQQTGVKCADASGARAMTGAELDALVPK